VLSTLSSLGGEQDEGRLSEALSAAVDHSPVDLAADISTARSHLDKLREQKQLALDSAEATERLIRATTALESTVPSQMLAEDLTCLAEELEEAAEEAQRLKIASEEVRQAEELLESVNAQMQEQAQRAVSHVTTALQAQ
jgi:hypothetical protein